ncbi:uncharacterized protein L3040_004728 [Drepanopeziza brunnea f. sp. 'multigermtubi']|uniref:uncharacterized protein n=1 Tax=Drepanopeziza brunnea f. sp. 'multigermtubi' TaxID=698441 RepID=UPI002399C86B|nr:hypothetical protein L3040_004728 [Drepanopeziza brunnea f. sp. 'multigermtubi']
MPSPANAQDATPSTASKGTDAPARLIQEVTAKQLATIRRNMELLLSDDGPRGESGGIGAGGGEDRMDRPKPAPNRRPFKKGAQDAFMGCGSLWLWG